MFTLHPHTSYPELLDFLHLCKENKVKRVRLDGATFFRVRYLIDATGNSLTASGVKFVEK